MTSWQRGSRPAAPNMTLKDIPYLSQWDDDAKLSRGDCLIVCVAMLAAWRGNPISPDALLRKAGLPVGRLTYTFAEGIVAARVAGVALRHVRPAAWNTIRVEIDAQRPVVALLRYGVLSGNQDSSDVAHFVVVLGYDATHVVMHDPNWWDERREEGAFRRVPLSEFQRAIGVPLSETGNMSWQSLYIV